MMDWVIPFAGFFMAGLVCAFWAWSRQHFAGSQPEDLEGHRLAADSYAMSSVFWGVASALFVGAVATIIASRLT